MRVLITGGAGFIGSNLVQYINQHATNVEVRVIDDLSTGRLSNLEGLNAEITVGSILDNTVLLRAAADVDAIIHLAAIGSVPRSVAAPRPTHDVNVTGTLNVLEAARQTGINHVIVASSSSVYGSNPAMPKSEFDWTRPMSPYGVSKLATEAYALAYGFSYEMKTLAFRFFNVFGPKQPADHDYAAVIPRFLDAAMDRRPLTVHGDGLQSRDFTYVETVCAVILEAMLTEVHSSNPVNLAFGTNVSLLELVGEIEMILGEKLELDFQPSRVGDVRASQSDGKRVRELFPAVSPVALGAGVRNTIEWFRESASLSGAK